MECIFTQRAERDLEAIGDYIAQDNPVRAVSFVQDIRARCQKITHMPGAPLVVERIEDVPVRKVLFGHYRIYYAWLEGEDIVLILHVRHGARSEPQFG